MGIYLNINPKSESLRIEVTYNGKLEGQSVWEIRSVTYNGKLEGQGVWEIRRPRRLGN